MPDMKRLNSLLSSSGTFLKKQDGGFLLYNTKSNLVSEGLLFTDLKSVESALLQYIRYVQTNGFSPLTEFSSSGMLRGVKYSTVHNTVDEGSAYFINKSASLSPVSRLNLLVSARTLEERASANVSLREMSRGITANTRKRYLKLKKIAHTHLLDKE